MAQLGAQLKSALGKCQQGQTALLREREKVREALLDSGKLAEVSMQFSAEQEPLTLTLTLTLTLPLPLPLPLTVTLTLYRFHSSVLVSRWIRQPGSGSSGCSGWG